MTSSILDVITHYQKSIEKSINDEARLLHCIKKLYKLPVTVEHLQATGVGKTVNSLRKCDKEEVGIAAKALVAKWKAMVAAEEINAPESDNEHKNSSNYDDSKDNGNGNSQNYASQSQCYLTSIQATSSTNRNSISSKPHTEKDKRRDYVNNQSFENNKLININSNSSSNNNCDRNNKHHRKHKSTRDSNTTLSYHSHSKDNKSYDKKFKNESLLNGFKAELTNSEYLELDNKIKKEIREEIENDYPSSTEYDDEKLVIDVKVKEDDDEEVEDKYNEEKDCIKGDLKTEKEIDNKHHKSFKLLSSNDNRNDKSEKSKSKSRSKSKDSKEKYDSKDKKTSHKRKHSHDSKSKDSKDTKEKCTDKESEKKHSSSHRSKIERHHSKEKKTEKDKLRMSSSIRDSHHEGKHKRKISDSSETTSPKQIKSTKISDSGIDNSMGRSFEEALGLLSGTSVSVLKATNKSSTKPKQSTSGNSSSGSTDDNFVKPSSRSICTKISTPDLLTSGANLKPLDPSISLELPTISPNYKPMPLNPTVMECVFNTKPQRRTMTDEEALAAGISSKTIRTKVYSGSKIGQTYQVPTLFELCTWVLQKNIDGLEYTGGVPFDILKPVLELATPQQLANFEEYNPYLMEDTDILWQKICSRNCKGVKRQELETWREMYMRCQEEREERLNKLTENIKQSQKQITQPLRKTQLAYVDSMVKPPRNIQRKQEQFGTTYKKVTTPAARVASLSNVAPNIAKAPIRINPNERDTAQASTHARPRKAPLMQKTLQFMKDDDDYVPSKGLKIEKSKYSLRNGLKEGIDIIPTEGKKRINQKYKLWKRRCLGLELEFNCNINSD